ncbi:hypothetical protein [Sphingobium sp.]|uniref:hypothetical protein n=1 Tax=Sphingobium sp. TaxID=1912891 RepID=UPI002BB0D83A|nr:hypothetical protein [Sphingobium sp.]HUD91230.1 hypothetical protein [Sphingobium sp.]
MPHDDSAAQVIYGIKRASLATIEMAETLRDVSDTLLRLDAALECMEMDLRVEPLGQDVAV